MNKENTEKLFNRFSFFHPERPITESLMAFGFDCDNGWFDIIWKLCEDLEIIIKEDNVKDFEVVQVKEKFGGLRFYTNGSNGLIDNVIHQAEKESYSTCEICGKKPASSKSINGWIRTLCEECNEKQNNY